MDGLSSALPVSANYPPNVAVSYNSIEASFSYKQLVIQKTLVESDQDAVSFDSSFLTGGHSVDVKAILQKINERLKGVLPEGVESLKPEDATPDATAERIVNGVTALFDVYSKRHPDLQGDELLSGFMETIRSGVQDGYDDAAGFLEGIGAFDVDGVRAGIEKTKSLIEEKLKAFEAKKREQLGLGDVSGTTASEIVKQAGASLALVA